MNKSKHPMSARFRKKMKKELRSASNQADSTVPNQDNIPEGLLSRLPKTRQKEESLLNSFKKNIANKKAKQNSHTSKRTTPGTVDEKSSPQNPHQEGQRWIKTLQKQTSAKRKVMTRHMSKKGPK